VLRDGSGGAFFGFVAADNQWAYLDSHFQSLGSGGYRTVGGPFENIQRQVAGLASGGQYTFYLWAKVSSGTRHVSMAIVDNADAGYLAGPTSITLTAAWQRFKITGTLAGGQTGLCIVVRQFAGNGDNWTSGAIYLWGACCSRATIRKMATPVSGCRRPPSPRPESRAARP
jgi:hypothetical protein